MALAFLRKWGSGVLAILLATTGFCFASKAAAQAPAAPQTGISEKPISAFYRETWTTRQGLPHNQINAIAQTPDGYLWLGTWEGLVRYNGFEFSLFNRSNTPALKDNGVRSLNVGVDGAVVVSTSRGGVSVLRGEHWETWTQANGLAQDEVMDAIVDRQGRLWAGTESKGLTLIDHGNAKQFNTTNGLLPSDVVFDLLEDRDGSIWVGTAAGLVHIVEGRVLRMQASAGLPASPVFQLLLTAHNGMLIGTERGAYKRIGHRDRFELLSPLLPADGVPSMTEDRSGHLWVGTVNNGLFRLTRTGLEHFTSLRELPGNRVAALLTDREGSIWAGTNAGLLRLTDAPFTTWNSEQGLSDDYVRSILQDSHGGIWIGTGRGLNYWENGKVLKTFEKSDGLPGDSILSLLEEADGSLLLGTYSNGVVRLRHGKVTDHYDNNTGMPGSNQVRALARASDGTLWFGTTRGLVRFRDGQYTLFGLAQGLPRDFILSLLMARDGSLWVGTSNGLARVVGDKAYPLDLRAVRGAQDVFGFHEDRDGTLWIATDRGLLRYRNGQLRGLGLEDGLPVDTLFAVVDDALGNLWLSSNRGVIRVARAEADAVMAGQHRQLRFDHFGEADGLVSAQCNGGSGPSAMRDSLGNLWIATARGAASVSPSALQKYRHTLPPVVVEQVLADGKPVPLAKTLHLPAGTNKLEFRFAAISFLMPRFLRYRYRLNGLDPIWVERGSQHTAQYTNLDPGNYRFNVTVSAPGLGQTWSQDATSIQIEVAAQPWQRRGVIAAALASLLLLIFGLYRWRVGALRRRAVQLEAMVEQRTHDLREHAERLAASDGEKSLLLERLRKQSDDFERMALEDALTGVGNRRSLDTALHAAFTRALQGDRDLCFALFDVDQFKQINDRYSHAAGDQALIAIAHALRDGLNGAGMLARWGGEEFAILFERVPLERVREICEAMRRRVESIDCSAYAPGWTLSVSAGITDRGNAQRYEALVARADELLYAAKRGGRNRIIG